MKKHLFAILCTTLLFTSASCGSPSNEPQEENNISATDQTAVSEEDNITQFIQDTVAEYYDKTTVDNINVNENAGTEEDGDFVVLVDLTWDVKNSVNTTKEMLEMYSSDLAARTNQQFESISEIAIFWNIPYHGSDGKVSYEKVEGGMKLSDKIFNF